MDIDVGSYISEVLYDKDQVSIPGLGGFEASYQSANADSVQGRMLPPTKQFVFRNVPGNDNFLVKYIKDQHNISYVDAQSVVEDYVGQVKNSIENKEIFVFPNIGRLYKDYEQELRFLPDKENFNKSTYGLPEVELFRPLKPITPEVEVKVQPIPQPKPVVTIPLPEQEAPQTWLQKYLIPIGVATMAISFYVLFAFMSSGLTTPPEEAGLKINEAPKSEDANAIPDNRSAIDAPDIVISADDDLEDRSENLKKSIDEFIQDGTPTPDPVKPYTATVSIDYSKQGYETGLVSNLRRYGYQDIKEYESGNKVTLSLTIDYATDDELNQLLGELKKRLDREDIRVKKNLKEANSAKSF